MEKGVAGKILLVAWVVLRMRRRFARADASMARANRNHLC